MNNKKNTTKATTIKDIAAAAGVSIGSVHRAIYGKEGISDETRQRILEEVKRQNYRINPVASSLKRKTLNIAVVLPRPEGEERFFFRGIWDGIRQSVSSLEKFNVNFHFFESEYSLDKISQTLQYIYDTNADELDGLITISDDAKSNEWIARLHRRGISVVLLSSYSHADNYFCCIKVEHEKQGKLVAEYIHSVCQQTEGKILVLTGSEHIFSNKRYSDAFLSKMHEYEPQREILCVNGFGAQAITEQCIHLLRTEPIACIFSCNARNTYAMGKVLEQLGRNDITFVGTDVFYELKPFFDNHILNASIYQYTQEQGIRAVEVLYQHISTDTQERGQVTMPTGLILGSNYEYFMH